MKIRRFEEEEAEEEEEEVEEEDMVVVVLWRAWASEVRVISGAVRGADVVEVWEKAGENALVPPKVACAAILLVDRDGDNVCCGTCVVFER